MPPQNNSNYGRTRNYCVVYDNIFVFGFRFSEIKDFDRRNRWVLLAEKQLTGRADDGVLSVKFGLYSEPFVLSGEPKTDTMLDFYRNITGYFLIA
jgi:hypothetical protein